MSAENPVIDLDNKPVAEAGNPFQDKGIEVAENAQSESQLIKLVTDHYQDDQDYHQDFFQNMVDDIGMWDGSRQWMLKNVLTGKYEDIEKSLAEQGKVAVTKNKIFPMINLVSGIESQEPLDMRAIATSGDSMTADGISEGLKWIWDRNKGPRKVSNQFQDTIKCGRGWIEIPQVESEDKNDLFGTKTQILYVDPGEITYDRNSREHDLSDCDHLLRMRVMSRSLAMLLFPDKKNELTQYFSGLDTQLDTQRYTESRNFIMGRTVFLMEDWYKVYKLKHFLLDSSMGQIHDVSDIADKDSQAIGFITKQMPHVKVIRKRLKVMKYIRTCGPVNGVLLDAGDSPYKDNYYPYVPMFGYRSRDLDFGMIRQPYGAQVEANKRATQTLYLLNQMVRTRLVTDDPKAADDFEQGEDVVVVGKGNSFKIIDPPQISQGHAALEAQAKEDIKEISGVNENLHGEQKRNEPGIVVSLRQRQGMTMIAQLFQNRQDSMEITAEILRSRMRQFMTPQQVAKILGPQKANPQLIQSILSHDTDDYKINIIETPSTPSVRAEQFARLEKFLEMFPELKPLVQDIAVDTADIPRKEEVEQRIQQAVQMMNQRVSTPQITSGAPPSPGAQPAGAPSEAPAPGGM
ncbi:MAG TPA: hypothetical protein VF790_11680 [Dissulfurispiraceae bacterium]